MTPPPVARRRVRLPPWLLLPLLGITTGTLLYLLYLAAGTLP